MTKYAGAEILNLVAARQGHFLLESGHHGDLWLELELLCSNPRRVKPFCDELTRCMIPFEAEVICGPLVEGAFVALFAAWQMGCAFVYSERCSRLKKDGLFPAGYRIPQPLRDMVQGKRTAIVNDVINAGSAVRGTFEDLEACGANVIGIAALLTLGNSARNFAESKKVPLVSLVQYPVNLWEPAVCPLCARSVPIEDPGGFLSRA